MLIVIEIEQIPNPQDSPLNSRAQIHDGFRFYPLRGSASRMRFRGRSGVQGVVNNDGSAGMRLGLPKFQAGIDASLFEDREAWVS